MNKKINSDIQRKGQVSQRYRYKQMIWVIKKEKEI